MCRTQYDDTSLRPERAFVIAAAGQCARRKHACRRDDITRLDEQTQRTEHLSCQTNWCQTRTLSKLQYSYSNSSSLMMTPASSSTVTMFHRRVGRHRMPMTCYLARRAVRRRTSSTDAWVHAAVSVDAPCRSCRTRQLSHVATLQLFIECLALMADATGRHQ